MVSTSTILTALISLLHVYILVLEMFLWTAPAGRKAFKLSPELATQTRPLAANMGLYNGFLAAGLAWGVFHPDQAFQAQLRIFFLGCVAVAGLVGAATARRRILYVQFVPGALALAATLLGM